MTTNIASKAKAKLSKGWGKLGAKLGQPYQWYQTTSNNNPLDPANDRGTFSCLIDRDSDFRLLRPDEYGKPIYFVAYDRKGPSVGDYLKGPSIHETYFIISQSDFTPTEIVRCNRTVNFYRVAPNEVSPDNWGEYQETNSLNHSHGDLMATQFPICLLSGSRGEQALMGGEIPTAGRQPWWVVYCPVIPGVNLRTDDQFVDEYNIRYVISSPELTILGWRMTAQLAQA